jgi:hypothetical protein
MKIFNTFTLYCITKFVASVTENIMTGCPGFIDPNLHEDFASVPCDGIAVSGLANAVWEGKSDESWAIEFGDPVHLKSFLLIEG